MANKLKTEVRINDKDWTTDVTLVLSDSQAVAVLERIVEGDTLRVSLLTSMVAPGEVGRDQPQAYAA